MNLGKKIKAMRIAEGLSQPEMAQLLDIPIGTLKGWEQSRREIKGETLTKITSYERFEKYAYWIMTGKTIPESGLIAPDFSILLECGVVDARENVRNLA